MFKAARRRSFWVTSPGPVEAELFVPDVDILMVAHHGSKYSTSEALLRAAQPEQAVLSYGRNGYGHPYSGVLERLYAHGVSVLETYGAGAVRLGLSSK